MENRYTVSPVHGESRSLFHVVNADAPEELQPFILMPFHGRDEAELAAFALNAQAARIRELEGALARFTEGRVPAIEKVDADWLDGFLADRRHARRILAQGGGA